MRSFRLCSAIFFVFGAIALAQQTECLSFDSLGNPGAGDCLTAVPSADGRYVAFSTDATGFVPLDTNNRRDVFVLDRATNAIELISTSISGTVGNGDSTFCDVSEDGRFVAFLSAATNLVAAGIDSSVSLDVYLRDRMIGTTTLISKDSSGFAAGGASVPLISADGRYVGFTSTASGLVPGDTNDFADVFVYDTLLDLMIRESVTTAGTQGNAASIAGDLSADGRYIVFTSTATNLIPLAPGASNQQLYLRDRLAWTTERVSQNSSGTAANGICLNPSLSADGRFVAFETLGNNWDPTDTNGLGDSYVLDRVSGALTRESLSFAGHTLSSASRHTRISDDGRLLTFATRSPNVVLFDNDLVQDVFVRNIALDVSWRVSQSTGGAASDQDSKFGRMNADGSLVVFLSRAGTLGAPANGFDQVFSSGFDLPCQPNLGYGHGLSNLVVWGSDLSTGTFGTLSLYHTQMMVPTLIYVSLALTPTFAPPLNATFAALPAVLVVPTFTNSLNRCDIPFAGGMGPLTLYVQAITPNLNLPGHPHDVSNVVQIDLLP